MRAGRHPSRLELAVWLAGDASDAQHTALSQHVERCGHCSAALAELRAHPGDEVGRAPIEQEISRPTVRVEGIAGEGAGWHRFVVGFAAIRLVASLVVLAIGGAMVVVIVSQLTSC